MSTILFHVNAPSVDINGNVASTVSFQNSMEAIAIDAVTRIDAGVYQFKAEVYQAQSQGLYWLILDTNLSTAESNYNTFKTSYTWGDVGPDYTAITLTANG